MFFPLLLVGFGWAMAKRGSPATTIRKTSSMGPLTGNHYDVEEVVGTGTLVVRVPKACEVVIRAENGRWHLVKKSCVEGAEGLLSDILRDFNVLEPSR